MAAALIKQFVNYTQLTDSTEYLQAAFNMLVSGFWSVSLPGYPAEHWLELTRRTPGYPLLIVLSAFMPLLLIALQSFIALFVPVISICILDIITTKGKAQTMLMIAFLLYPLQFYYPNLLMPELFVQLFLLLAVLCIVEKRYHFFPIYLSILILLKPVFVLFLPLTLLFLYLPGKQKIVQFMPIFIFLLVGWINKSQTGWFHYSAIASENSYEYNLRAVMNKVNSEAEIVQIQSRHDSVLQSLNYYERAQFMQRITREKISAHPLLYLYLHTKGCLAALLDPGRYDLIAFFGLEEGKGFMGIKSAGSKGYFNQPLPILIYLIAFLLVRIAVVICALWWFIKGENSIRLKLIVLVPLVILLGVTGPVGSARYLFPVAPLLFIMAASGAVLIKYRIKR